VIGACLLDIRRADRLRSTAVTLETTCSQAREQLKSLMDRAVEDRESALRSEFLQGRYHC
jgi:hypothetical protein